MHVCICIMVIRYMYLDLHPPYVLAVLHCELFLLLLPGETPLLTHTRTHSLSHTHLHFHTLTCTQVSKTLCSGFCRNQSLHTRSNVSLTNTHQACTHINPGVGMGNSMPWALFGRSQHNYLCFCFCSRALLSLLYTQSFFLPQQMHWDAGFETQACLTGCPHSKDNLSLNIIEQW